MALRNIMEKGEPCLSKHCRPVTDFNAKLHTLLDDMAETLLKANGVGLAAPQIGVLRRIVVVDLGDEIVELVNPRILEQSGEQDGLEGCLSVPNRFGLVKRPSFVKLEAQDRYGDWYEYEGEDLIARCFCHELEHLDGHLYTERAYRMLTEEEYEKLMREHGGKVE